MKSSRLLELVDYKQTKEEFYGLLKKIDGIIFKAELNLDKLNSFKEKIHKKLDEYLNSRFQSDIFIIPLMISVLRKSFYRSKKESELRRTTMSIENKATNMNYTYQASEQHSKKVKYSGMNNDKAPYTKNGHLLLESFKIIFSYIVKDHCIEILLNALNYIYKFFEDPISYEIDSKYFLVSIINIYLKILRFKNLSLIFKNILLIS